MNKDEKLKKFSAKKFKFDLRYKKYAQRSRLNLQAEKSKNQEFQKINIKKFFLVFLTNFASRMTVRKIFPCNLILTVKTPRFGKKIKLWVSQINSPKI